jgi:hydrogenase maturation factor
VTPYPESLGVSCTPDGNGACSLCGDVAVRAKIVSIDQDAGMAIACSGDVELSVALDLIEPPTVGDTILVHQGFAIARVEVP